MQSTTRWALCGTVGPQVQIAEDFKTSVCRCCMLETEWKSSEDRGGSGEIRGRVGISFEHTVRPPRPGRDLTIYFFPSTTRRSSPGIAETSTLSHGSLAARTISIVALLP